MLKNLGIIQACCHSRDYHCRAARKLGGRSVLEWVIRRVTDSLRLDGIIVLCCDDADHRFMRTLVPPDVPIFIGTRADALGRFSQALEQYPCEAVVRVRGDRIFIDPALIDALVATANAYAQSDYVCYAFRDGRLAINSPVGIFAEWFRASALHKTARAAKKKHDREHVTHYMHSHPEKFNIRLIPAPAEIEREDLRFTVEGEEDWDHVLTIYEALGPERMDWRQITELLNHQPALRSRMAALNQTQAHAQW
ncbi:MAG: cytidylyltransferase domain-containing protein [Thermoguttaceae bacterium]